MVFQCRDEGPLRAHVAWRRGNGLPLPDGTRDYRGRLEMPNVQVSSLSNLTLFGKPKKYEIFNARCNIMLNTILTRSLNLRLFNVKNIAYKGFLCYYEKWLKTLGARQMGSYHSDFKTIFFPNTLGQKTSDSKG